MDAHLQIIFVNGTSSIAIGEKGLRVLFACLKIDDSCFLCFEPTRSEVWTKNNVRLAMNSGEKNAKRPHLLALHLLNFCAF